MSNEPKVGADLHGDDPQARKLAAATMGSARTPAKVEAARQNALAAAQARIGKGTTDTQKEAVRDYWKRYRAEKAAETPATATATEPRRRGRPAKPQPETAESRRPRGRPRKDATAQHTQETIDALQAAP